MMNKKSILKFIAVLKNNANNAHWWTHTISSSLSRVQTNSQWNTEEVNIVEHQKMNHDYTPNLETKPFAWFCKS